MKLVPKKENRTAKDNDNMQGGKSTDQVRKIVPGGLKGRISSLKEHLPKQFNPSKSVGIRLFLIFFIAIMFFVLAIGIISYQMAKNTIQDNAELANQQTIVQTSQKLDIILQKYRDNLQQTFLDEEMQKAITDALLSDVTDYDRFVTSTKLQTRLNTFSLTSPGVIGTYMMGEEDNFDIVTTGNVDQKFLDSIKEQPWYDTVSKSSETFWTNVTDYESSGSGVFRLVRSIQSVNGMKRFILVADIRLDILTQYLNELDLGEGSRVQLLTNDNTVVTSSVAEQEGKTTDVDLSKVGTELLGGIRTKDGNKQPVLAVYNTQATSGWKLLGTIPTAQLTKDAQGILITTYVSAAIVGLIAILIGIWMVRMIAHPLSKLRNLMEEGSKGNLSVRMNLKSKDEIGQLTVSFNVMMEQITALVNQTNNSAKDVLDTASELTDASNKTALSAREIAVATEEIANGATSLANEAERGNELTENITNQMEGFITANREMAGSAKEVEKSSQLGTEYLNGLLQKTNKTVDIVNALTEKVDSLKSSTSSVMKVLEVMQTITQQTNILSLNATIEAARAGAAGRGFMVVADEIRQLADQSRRSITMVGEITDKIGQEMNETVQALSDAGPLFQEQIVSVKETNQIFISVQQQMEGFVHYLDAVTVSIEELNQSQNVMSDAMSNVSAVAEQSSATSQEVASLSTEQQVVGEQLVQLSGKLEKVSSGLKESLSKFTI
ncbi:methyl-accepting chemotaxis protein [Paenibacillus anaericanus]|nr:methyl-accepting chemotaxis protein [Paenibacillus anaericanus]MDQ0090062.1 methyl-accepting chemotaxis protein [Paenibacillus anaericanus]